MPPAGSRQWQGKFKWKKARGGSGRRFGLAEVELLHSGAQGAGVEVQNRRRTRLALDHPARVFQHLEDIGPLHGFERAQGFGTPRRFAIFQTAFQRAVDLQQRAAGEDGGAFDDVLQLPDIAGPIVALQLDPPLRRQGRDRTPALPGQPPGESLGE